MSTKYADVSFGKVDVDENPDASAEFKISAVPTFVFFHGQEQTESFSGADPSKLESMVKDLQAK
jgi:thioredoxin-like negative regulator of GroEL